MCGILVFLPKKRSHYTTIDIHSLMNKLEHRGPDAEGMIATNEIVLAHKRLSIIDLSDAGTQPMSIKEADYPASIFEDEQFVIVFNGEIYNYKEIREKLKRKGISFNSETDTEVLLKLFTIRGFDSLQMLNGQFVFLIWDKKAKVLSVARDRFGIKPLYYSDLGDCWVFCSEMKPILAVQKNVKPNNATVYDYLLYSNVDHSDNTFFEGVHRFPAANYAIIEDGIFSIHRYWDLLEEVKKLRKDKLFKKRTMKEHITTVKRLFDESVSLRLRADVKVGSCCSGGIDSSSVVCSANQILSEKEKVNFELFSLVYGDWFSLDEREYIEMVGNNTGLEQNFITATIEDVNKLFVDYLRCQEEPTTTFSAFGQYRVMQLAKSRGVKVLLDGQGGDELMAGYPPLSGYAYFDWFKRFRWIRLVKEILRQKKNKMALQIFAIQFLPASIVNRLWKRQKGFSNYLQDNFVDTHKTGTPSFVLRKSMLRKPLYENSVKVLVDNFQSLLRFEDRNSMRFSIEARVPFLDHHFATYILALPAEYILRGGVTKWIFRRAMAGITPREILSRQDKVGFASPEFHWLRDERLQIVKDLENAHNKLTDYIKTDKLSTLIDKRDQQTATTAELRVLFRIAELNAWLNIFIKE